MNRLAGETSPYLRQHADNPVDWYPWGDEAFARARADDRPVLLSVGYSSCHWCHVMAHESFEDPETAASMNHRFVNVKVDREERPDVDAVYMHAVVATTGHGGWPMTVFLTPDGRPFLAGTYFPHEPRPGIPSFREVLDAVAQAWADQRDTVLDRAGRIRDALAATTGLSGAHGVDALDAEVLVRAVANCATQFDARWGGFGHPPKFPPAMALDFLARAHARDPQPGTLEMITTTLDAMAAGGIHDHVGGGFARYSVDGFWLVPHFEKMLYDQALLLRAYTDGWLLTGEPRYRRVAEGIVAYALRDLRQPEGGFSSAEDADSEGVEGKFYLWSRGEIDEACGSDAPEVIRFFGVTDSGNFEDPHTGFRGNILHAVDRHAEPSEVLHRALPLLFQQRATRVRPGLDDKVLLGWNALFARSLAEAAAAFGRSDWLTAARDNIEFLLGALRRGDGRRLRSWQGGRARHLAVAQDYGALLEALLTLAELDDVAWLGEARAVADELLALFHDPDGDGFFTVGADAEPLIVRAKDSQDNAVPSENALAACGLLRLAALSGELRYEQPAREVLARLAGSASEHPTAFGYLLVALERAVLPPLEVAVVGTPGDPTVDALRREIHGRLLPAAVTVSAAPGTGGTPLLDGRNLLDGRAAAYVCERFACRQPVGDPEALRALLDEARGPAPVQ